MAQGRPPSPESAALALAEDIRALVMTLDDLTRALDRKLMEMVEAASRARATASVRRGG